MGKFLQKIYNNRLVLLIIIWNLVDILVHVAVDMVEPLRVTGNVVGILAAILILPKLFRKLRMQMLVGASILVTALNSWFAADNGAKIPMLIFIGVSVYLLLKLAQSHSKAKSLNLLNKWWAKPLGAVVSCLLVVGSAGLFG